MTTPVLIDGFGRIHRSLRVSVTDRCNIRCAYCMPPDQVIFRPRAELLTFEEICRFVRIACSLGIRKVRLTGGEPLVRSELPRLVHMLSALPDVEDLALTTNGILLSEQASDLRAAGLMRLNISLDTLREDRFQQLTRRPGLDRVLEGIRAARRAGFDQLRINAIALRDFTEAEIEPLVEFARVEGLHLRFIEFMPLDGEAAWQRQSVLSGAEIRTRIESRFGPLVSSARPDSAQPAVDFEFRDGCGKIGFINPVTQPFCGDCDRLRLTAEGQVRNCLFSSVEWDARHIFRSGGGDDDVRRLVTDCLAAKKPGHGIDSTEFLRPSRAMYQIGG